MRPLGATAAGAAATGELPSPASMAADGGGRFRRTGAREPRSESRSPRPRGARALRTFGWLTALVAFFSLLPTLPAVSGALGIEPLLGRSGRVASDVVSVLVGFALIALAYQLGRGRRPAWRLAVRCSPSARSPTGSAARTRSSTVLDLGMVAGLLVWRAALPDPGRPALGLRAAPAAADLPRRRRRLRTLLAVHRALPDRARADGRRRPGDDIRRTRRARRSVPVPECPVLGLLRGGAARARRARPAGIRVPGLQAARTARAAPPPTTAPGLARWSVATVTIRSPTSPCTPARAISSPATGRR